MVGYVVGGVGVWDTHIPTYILLLTI
jgi:hypothetical protein